MSNVRIITADVRYGLAQLEDESVQCVVTSPPYWGLRDYGVEGQIGLETTSQEYVAGLVEVFRDVWRVLRDDGTLWLNLGDCYGGPLATIDPDSVTQKTTAGRQSTRDVPGRQVRGPKT